MYVRPAVEDVASEYRKGEELACQLPCARRLERTWALRHAMAHAVDGTAMTCSERQTSVRLAAHARPGRAVG